MTILLRNFRLIDETSDKPGALLAENGRIAAVFDAGAKLPAADTVIDGGDLTGGRALPALLPAFVDMHAHFRDPGFPQKETLETGSRAAAAGGFGTVAVMANTNPVTDTIGRAAEIKNRADALGIADIFPVLSLTHNMEGKILSEITRLTEVSNINILLLSEDGKDVQDDALFSRAFACAAHAGIPVSCHCDLGGEDSASARALSLGLKAGAHVHIAHVSTAASVNAIRAAKTAGGSVSCEVTPHHLSLTAQDAASLGAQTFGRVAPPLRNEQDRRSLAGAVSDGSVDCIATDHAPHTASDKLSGAPGFSGLETAFSVCYGILVKSGAIPLSRLSSLMSASPARLLGFKDSRSRGLLQPSYRADLCVIDLDAVWTVEAQHLVSLGKNTPFAGRQLPGKILLTMQRGNIVFDRRRQYV